MSGFKNLLEIHVKGVRILAKHLSQEKQYDVPLNGISLVRTEIVLLLEFPQLRFTPLAVWKVSRTR
jgi:hypothetical protein